MKLARPLGLLAFGFLLLGVRAEAEELAVGDKAPAFKLQGSDGKEHDSAEYFGKKGVVLAWFPKAFTPG